MVYRATNERGKTMKEINKMTSTKLPVGVMSEGKSLGGTYLQMPAKVLALLTRLSGGHTDVRFVVVLFI